MPQKEPLQCDRTICQVLNIGFFLSFLFFLFFALPALADYQQTDYSAEGNYGTTDGCTYYLGTGLSGTLSALQWYGTCMKVGGQLCWFQLDECSGATQYSGCDGFITAYYSSLGDYDPVIGVKTNTFSDVVFDPTHYYFLRMCLSDSQHTIKPFYGTTNIFGDTWFVYNTYNLKAPYFDLIGVNATTPGTPGGGEVSVADNWFCCDGYCGYPVSMPAQLGWWGIGATTTRELLWGLDNNPITNSVDFTNITNTTINVASSTSWGYHSFRYQILIGGEVAATGTTQIQIVAGSACADTSDYDINYFCTYPCAGLATSTNPIDFENFLCALRKFGCWMIIPTPGSISYVMGQFNGLTANFPLAPIKKMYDNLNVMATGTQALAPGVISIPSYATATAQYIGTNYDIGSSTMTMSSGFQKFRRFETILIYCLLCALPTTFILLRLITPL